jgi:glucose/mannose-6-phosphate isomerase
VPPLLRGGAIVADADETAAWLADRIPVTYTDESHLLSVARVAKIKFNENAKRPAFFNALPEANHNEMVGFTKALGEFAILYLHDPDSHPRVALRYEALETLFGRSGIRNVAFRRWTMPGGTRVQRVFAALLFAERCAYARALLDGFDPAPVRLVEAFKEMLRDDRR